MNYDHTWQAIWNIGETAEYFLHKLPKFDTNISSFSTVNAWWLAEISRLTYKHGRKTRKNILEENGFFDVMEMTTGRSCGLFCSGYDINNNLFHILAFKGTDSLHDWVGNFTMLPSKWQYGGIVHKGFIDAYTLIENYVKLGAENKSKIYITGHSLGGALSILATTEIGKSVSAVYTFGAPKVGDKAFNDLLKNIPIYRIANENDIVTKIPPIKNIMNIEHAGEAIYFNQSGMLSSQKTATSNVTDNIKWRKNISQLLDPPMFISDHAPINYVSNIYRYFKSNNNS